MVHILSLLLGLAIIGSTTAARPYKHRRVAKVTLYEAHPVAEASKSEEFSSGPERLSTIVPLDVDNCLWGDFPIANLLFSNMPQCTLGVRSVAFIYPTTSCTGSPTFRSDKHVGNLRLPKLLVSFSSTEWSMVIRCDTLESQAIESSHYVQAIAPSHNHRPVFKSKISAGVVTPHTSIDCTTEKPKEPIFLLPNTCFDLSEPEGQSVFINKPAVCSDGSYALAEFFKKPGCDHRGEDFELWMERPVGALLEKQCFYEGLQVRSIRFLCPRNDLNLDEKLPAHQHPEVAPLVVREEPMPAQDDKLVVDTPNTETLSKPTSDSSISAQSTKPQGGKIQPHWLEDCKVDQGRTDRGSVEAVDTCVWTFMYKSMEVLSPAICANGTQALFATYSRPGCKPDDLKYLGAIPDEFTDGCADIARIDSFAFICEGLPETEIGNKGSVGGFLKFVGFVLLILVLMVALSIASCCLRGAAMMKQANELWVKIMNAFRGREGAIQL
ncbi:hypothetical protein V8E51_010583 [Hyaloscypha variabilis]